MESNKLLDKDIPSAMRRINQAVSEIGSSLDEISSTRGNEPDPAYIAAADRSSAAGQAGTSRTDLAERLDTLAARLSESGITLELAAMDDLAGCRENVINTLYRVCQESVTNAIKHGQASRITLSIKSKAGTVELFIVDNGKGCMSLIKGTGLTSMEERVRELNGTISFGSFEDREGFMVRVGIPIQL
jgi:signal transduction histidine kinase